MDTFNSLDMEYYMEMDIINGEGGIIISESVFFILFWDQLL